MNNHHNLLPVCFPLIPENHTPEVFHKELTREKSKSFNWIVSTRHHVLTAFAVSFGCAYLYYQYVHQCCWLCLMVGGRVRIPKFHWHHDSGVGDACFSSRDPKEASPQQCAHQKRRAWHQGEQNHANGVMYPQKQEKQKVATVKLRSFWTIKVGPQKNLQHFAFTFLQRQVSHEKDLLTFHWILVG